MAWRTIIRYSLIILFGLLVTNLLYAAPPSRIYTYNSGNVISPDEVTANEDAIFNYLTRGVDTFSGGITTDNITDGTLTTADISGTAGITYGKLSFSNNIVAGDIAAGAIGDSELAATTVTAGAYTNASLTVDADGRLTAASSGATAILYTDARFKVIALTRAMDAANGNVAYTGAGFQPKGLIFIGAINSTNSFGIGFSSTTVTDDGSIASTDNNTMTPISSGCLRIVEAGSGNTKAQEAVVASYDSDGFTLTWAKTGSPASATATIYVLAFR